MLRQRISSHPDPRRGTLTREDYGCDRGKFQFSCLSCAAPLRQSAAYTNNCRLTPELLAQFAQPSAFLRHSQEQLISL